MDTSPKTVREHIARAKYFLQKKDLLKCLKSLALALELLASGQIFGRERIEIDVLMDEGVRSLMDNEALKRALPAPLAYRKGQERELAAGLSRLAAVLESVLEKARMEERRRRLADLDEMILSGQAELDQKQPTEARKHFRRAAELFADEPGLFSDIGNRLMLGGLAAEAAEYLQRAIEAAPADLRAYAALTQCHDALGEGDKAEEVARTALRRCGPAEAMHLRLARGALERRGWDEALTNAQAALALNPLGKEAARVAAAASQHIYGDPQGYLRQGARPAGSGTEIKLDL